MAESVTIARPYAQAIFRLARESRHLAEWSERLQRLAMIARDPEMAAFVRNPKFSSRQVSELFLSIAGESGNKETVSFVTLLAENERLEILGEISEIFEQLKSDDEGVKVALITSAFPLEDSQLTLLMSQLEEHFGSRLQSQVEVDPSLIGGVRVAVGDQILDASVRGKLDAMAAALKN
ncbi:MAG: F0F1 ATP synthase subunit delta [Propionivibrio sp.]